MSKPESSKSKDIVRTMKKGAVRVAMAGVTIAAPGTVAVNTAKADVNPTGGQSYPAAGPSTGGEKAPGYTGNPTERELKVNALGQQGMDFMARRFVRGKIANLAKGGVKQHDNAPDINGDATTTLTMTIPANSMYGGRAAYQFGVVAELGRGGKPILDNVEQITATQGKINSEGIFTKTYATVSMQRDKTTGLISAHGLYASPKAVDTYSEVDAAVVPGVYVDGSSQPRLTIDRVKATIDQFGSFAFSAIHDQPAGAVGQAFTVPSQEASPGI